MVACTNIQQGVRVKHRPETLSPWGPPMVYGANELSRDGVIYLHFGLGVAKEEPN